MKLKEALQKDNLLSVYFTAGYPKLDDTCTIIEALEESGADIIEVGIPFSDPVADGPTIQKSNAAALKNGMNMKLLFQQLKRRKNKDVPLILMGYLNPVMQFGVDNFIEEAAESGIVGMIIPDLPIYEYEKFYSAKFKECGLSNIFLITPQTSDERIKMIDDLTDSFIYAVSSTSITGAKESLSVPQIEYMKRLKALQLKSPCLVGFGISNSEMYREVCSFSKGAIIGSAFINMVTESENLAKDISIFVKSIKN